MNRHYARTFAGLGLVLLALVVAALLANSGAAEARTRYLAMLARDQGSRRQRDVRQADLARLGGAIEPVRQFTTAWAPTARLPAHNAAEKLRSDIEAIAQRQLGLVTDNAITPAPDKFMFQGLPLPVQRVTLRASGKDLIALLAWLGRVEEKYPAALVEQCEFSSNVGGNTGLTIRLVQPLQDSGARAPAVAPLVPDAALQPEAIAALHWPRYLPGRLKAPVAVGFARNPLQPAVAADARSLPVVRDGSDEVSPRVEAALDGRIRSVIRGPSPLVVIDGRMFRIGDEIVVGTGRERPVAGAKTRLKGIGDDRLVFHVAGGTADQPLQCDVIYALPAFLKSR